MTDLAEDTSGTSDQRNPALNSEEINRRDAAEQLSEPKRTHYAKCLVSHRTEQVFGIKL